MNTFTHREVYWETTRFSITQKFDQGLRFPDLDNEDLENEDVFFISPTR